MGKLDLSTYKNVLSVRAAWRFDIATMLMRMYGYMFTIGTVSMLTLSGYSAFIAGTIAATLSLATFLVAPRIGKIIDERGQHTIVPVVSAISLAGLAILIATVVMRLPLPLAYIGAFLIGTAPNAQALARTRWAFLIKTKKFGAEKNDVRSAYAYEGVLEDIAFTCSPAINIALAAAIHPTAGMIFGGLCLIAGAVILHGARNTEPAVGWQPADVEATDQSDDAASSIVARYDRFNNPNSVWVTKKNRSVFVLSGSVRTLFVCTLLLGLVFASYDSTTVVFCQSIGQTTLASFDMAMSGILSAVAGLIFGMMRFKCSTSKVLLNAGAMFGITYAATALVFNDISLLMFTALASPFYAPFFITANTVCEKCIPGARLTEGITWMNAGLTAGFALGTTVAGLIMDTFGGPSGYYVVGIAGLLIPVTIFIAQGVLNRDLGE